MAAVFKKSLRPVIPIELNIKSYYEQKYTFLSNNPFSDNREGLLLECG
jgi:hypothetical protein